MGLHLLLLFLSASFLLAKAFNDAKWPEIKKYCKQNSANLQNFPIYERIFSETRHFPAEDEFQCYLACLAIKSNVLSLTSDLAINWRKMKHLFPKNKAYECQKMVDEQDPCRKVYQYFDCLRKGIPGDRSVLIIPEGNGTYERSNVSNFELQALYR